MPNYASKNPVAMGLWDPLLLHFKRPFFIFQSSNRCMVFKFVSFGNNQFLLSGYVQSTAERHSNEKLFTLR